VLQIEILVEPVLSPYKKQNRRSILLDCLLGCMVSVSGRIEGFVCGNSLPRAIQGREGFVATVRRGMWGLEWLLL
jgi:hypothetical protein